MAANAAIHKPQLTNRGILLKYIRRRVPEVGLLLPALLFVGGVIIYPLGTMFSLSFRSYRLTRPWEAGKFIGLTHYIRLISDVNFWNSVRVSMVYTLATVLGAFVVGLLLALLLNRKIRGIGVVRALLTLPWAIPGAVAAVTWLLMFQESFGVLNYLLRAAGIVSGDVPWVTEGRTALLAVIIAAIWKVYPFNTMVILAGLQAIPEELYEAAEVDGGSTWVKFRWITWPALRYVNTVAILLTAMHAIREFEQIYILTEGGPARATETLALQVYQEAFQFMDFGYASAVGVAVLAISLAFAAVFIRLMRAEFY